MGKIGVVIVAGGSGSRMGADVPKQFLMLGGEPILVRTVRRFLEALPKSEVVVVLPEAHLGQWADYQAEYSLDEEVKAVAGGATRFESVKSGLSALGADCELVAIHDGVRPLLSTQMIERGVAEAQKFGAVIPVIEVVDSLRRVDSDGRTQHIDRSSMRAVQTPQIFDTETIRKAYECEFRATFTDDASVVEASGVQIHLYQGEATNIKITTPADLLYAEALLSSKF